MASVDNNLNEYNWTNDFTSADRCHHPPRRRADAEELQGFVGQTVDHGCGMGAIPGSRLPDHV
jgi:hypothetical protein